MTKASVCTCGGAQSLVKSFQLCVGVQPPQLQAGVHFTALNNVKKKNVLVRGVREYRSRVCPKSG
jgi:hypothetical protein